MYENRKTCFLKVKEKTSWCSEQPENPPPPLPTILLSGIQSLESRTDALGQGSDCNGIWETVASSVKLSRPTSSRSKGGGINPRCNPTSTKTLSLSCLPGFEYLTASRHPFCHHLHCVYTAQCRALTELHRDPAFIVTGDFNF